MPKTIFKNKTDEDKVAEDSMRRLDMQYVQMAYELERLAKLSKKVEEIHTKLTEIEQSISSNGIKSQFIPASEKTKNAIKLILQKHGELTALQLSRIIKLSRTRCNEYLKEMELEGITTSRLDCRKKLYRLRH
jgi:response regulator of citrate/malate metabolism